ncbi:MAG: energy transducer TonB [Hyphomonadaceae bacterium]
MSRDPTHGATVVRASKGGGASKWLIGAVAAAVLGGGGYVAWQSLGASHQDGPDAAYTDELAPDPLRAGPISPAQDPFADPAGAAEAPVAQTAEAPAPAPRTAPRAAARTQDVPEQTIGVTPASYDTESDEIVVTPGHRPIWSRTPTARRLSSFYPVRDLERGREGEARLSCTVQAGGVLDCTPVSATSRGFGSAAVRVARTFRHAPRTANGGDATGTPVNLRVVFRIDDSARG